MGVKKRAPHLDGVNVLARCVLCSDLCMAEKGKVVGNDFGNRYNVSKNQHVSDVSTIYETAQFQK